MLNSLNQKTCRLFKAVVVNNLSAKEVAVIKKQMAKLGGEAAGPSGKIANKRENTITTI